MFGLVFILYIDMYFIWGVIDKSLKYPEYA